MFEKCVIHVLRPYTQKSLEDDPYITRWIVSCWSLIVLWFRSNSCPGQNVLSLAVKLCIAFRIFKVFLLISLAFFRYHYFLQLKNDVIEGRMSCDPKQAVLLASYSMQGED